MVGLIGLIVYGFGFIDFAGCSWCGLMLIRYLTVGLVVSGFA